MVVNVARFTACVHIMFCKHWESTVCTGVPYKGHSEPSPGVRQEGSPRQASPEAPGLPGGSRPWKGGPATLLPALPQGCGGPPPLLPFPGHLPQDRGGGARLGDGRSSPLRALASGRFAPDRPLLRWSPCPCPPSLICLVGGQAGGGGPRGGVCRTCVTTSGHAGALAADEGLQGPLLPWQRPAAEPTGTARTGHATGSALGQRAQGAAAAVGGPGALGAGVRYRRAERQLLRRAGRTLPRLGGPGGRAEPGGQQEQKQPGAGSGGPGHRRAAVVDRQTLALAVGGEGAVAGARARCSLGAACTL